VRPSPKSNKGRNRPGAVNPLTAPRRICGERRRMRTPRLSSKVAAVPTRKVARPPKREVGFREAKRPGAHTPVGPWPAASPPRGARGARSARMVASGVGLRPRMPEATLYGWLRRGWLKARQQQRPPQRSIVWADETEVERLKHFRARPVDEYLRRLWVSGPPPRVEHSP
jgi:hypothetical protein